MPIFNRITRLIKYRDLDVQAKVLSEIKNKDDKAKLQADIERLDDRAGKSEANFKNFSNVLIMSATFAFGLASALFGAPLWALLLGLGLFGLSFAYQSLGLTIETNRNQSQSDTITRTLYDKKQKGLDIGEIDKESLKKKNKQNIINKIENAASVSDPKESKALLEKAIKKDQRNTRREQFFKVMYFALYIAALGVLTAGGPYFMMSTTAVLAAAGSLFVSAFIADGIGARLEANRNINQTVGLRLIRLANIDADKKNELSKASDIPNVAGAKKSGSLVTNDNYKRFTDKVIASRQDKEVVLSR